MAEKLASLRKKGGGKMSETVLWTNPNPNASTFVGQTVTLSKSIQDYNYVKIKYKYNYNPDYANLTMEIIVSIDEFVKAGNRSNGVRVTLGVVSATGSVYHYDRYVNYVNNTSIQFEDCLQINYGGIVVYENAATIPLLIAGLK